MATQTRPETRARSFSGNLESELAAKFLRVVETRPVLPPAPWGKGIACYPTEWPQKPCGKPWTIFPCAAPS